MKTLSDRARDKQPVAALMRGGDYSQLFLEHVLSLDLQLGENYTGTQSGKVSKQKSKKVKSKYKSISECLLWIMVVKQAFPSAFNYRFPPPV